MRRLALFSTLLLAVASASGNAQTSAPPTPNDSLFRRARRMVSEGNGAAGRALVDSLLRSETEGSAGYGDALYWRGALAETAAEAERDYRRVIVEYPLSLYADDALLAIAELEQARGDRAGALQHLQRFVREHPVSSARGVAALAAARLAFEQRDTRTGCAMIAEARASASTSDVELRNQVDYFAGRCATGVAVEPGLPSASSMSSSAPPARDTTTPVSSQPRRAAAADVNAKSAAPAKPAVAAPAKPADKTPNSASAKTPDVRAKPSIGKTAPKTSQTAATVAAQPNEKGKAASTEARGNYTIQLAAYSTLADAERLIAKLAARGVKARVSGATKPFRVRLDFYPTRQAALDAVASLKQQGIVGFVTTEAPRPGEKAP